LSDALTGASPSTAHSRVILTPEKINNKNDAYLEHKKNYICKILI
jgi:hypothetical protein